MRILVVSPSPPWPLDQGYRVRLFNFLEELSKRNEVDLVAAIDHRYSAASDATRHLSAVCRRVYLETLPNKDILRRAFYKCTWKLNHWTKSISRSEFYYNLGPFVRRVDSLTAGDYDVMLTNWWYTAIRPVLGAQTPTICDTVDVVCESSLRQLVAEERLTSAALRHWKRQRAREAAVLNQHDLLICCHEKDQQTLHRMGVSTPSVAIAHVRQTVPLTYAPNPQRDDTLLFFGALHSPMNADAVKRAALDILPRVRAQIPSVQLVIAGSGAGPDVRRLAEVDDVRFVGYQPDLSSVYASAGLLVMPLRIGSGIKGRVLEAMEAGLPVVGSSVAAEGIRATAGVHMVVTDDMDEMAAACVRLLKNPAERLAMAAAARSLVETVYSWSSTYGRIHDCIEAARSSYGSSQTRQLAPLAVSPVG